MAEVGRYYDEGFAEGITKHIDDVTKAANRVAQESATGVYSASRSRDEQSRKTDDGAGNERLEQILEQYLPKILDEMKSESGVTVKGLAQAISPYIDEDLGRTERRKRRGN